MRNTTLAAAFIACFVIVAYVQRDDAAASYRPAPHRLVVAAQQAKPPPRHTTAKRAWIICHIFPRCRRALNVAWCESSLRPWAGLGQYRGMWQMGAAERRRYGHGRGAWKQTRAAKRYWNQSHWRPWQCQPDR